jgi:hypothetical protein
MSTAKRTMFAQAAFEYSTYFAAGLGNIQVAGTCIRRPHLVAPEGMSTVGGKQVRQHITLRPEVPGYAVLTVGAVDVTKGSATIRTFGYLRKAHEARYPDRPFDLDGISYQNFLTQAQDFFARQGMRVDVESEPPLGQIVRPAPKKSNTRTIILAVVAVFVLIVLALVAVAGFLYIHYYM